MLAAGPGPPLSVYFLEIGAAKSANRKKPLPSGWRLSGIQEK
jgi:hypothetical protein